MRKLIYLLMASVILLSACDKKEQEEVKSPVEGKKIIYIINMAPSGIFEVCADQCMKTAKSLGMLCDVVFTRGDHEQFQRVVAECADGYDGLFLSHGGKDYSYDMIREITAKYPDLKIVTFDTVFEDKDGNTQKIPGVTQFFQDDKDLASKLLEYGCETLCPDKRPLKVLKVWKGPDYLASFDRREVGYQKFVDAGKVQTVETIWPEDSLNPWNTMQTLMQKTLEKYTEKDIDLIWVAYDLYAQGSYPALMASGKSIPMVSIDICQQDADYMKEKNSLWMACACTDFAANGEQGIRILALELNGDYDDIKAPGTDTPTDYLEMPATLITQEHVRQSKTPESYGDPANFVTNEWLRALIGY